MSEQTYRCDLCAERFETEDALRDHWLEMHEAREPVATASRS
jgi:hypothetical protein